jgi:hypothetical protein
MNDFTCHKREQLMKMEMPRCSIIFSYRKIEYKSLYCRMGLFVWTITVNMSVWLSYIGVCELYVSSSLPENKTTGLLSVKVEKNVASGIVLSGLGAVILLTAIGLIVWSYYPLCISSSWTKVKVRIPRKS